METNKIPIQTGLFQREERIRKILLAIAFSSLSVLLLIIIFIFREGLPAIYQVGLSDFLKGTRWAPTKGFFGIFPMIIGTLEVTLAALFWGVPLSLFIAVYLSEFASPLARNIMKPVIELLAAIPSVVYGFMGVVIIVPFIRQYSGQSGFSVAAAAIILGIMILPTIVSITIDSLRAVPVSYREGGLALGATPWQTVIRVVLPAAKSGIVTAIILGMGRAMGETMAVIMVAGNAVVIPRSLFDPCRTLTSNIALEMSYASGMHQKALFATGVVLFIMIFFLNLIATLLIKRKNSRT